MPALRRNGSRSSTRTRWCRGALRLRSRSRPFPELQIEGYEILGCLGEGGMGIVYLARQVSLDRKVAIKVMSPALLKDPSFVARFDREIAALVRLSHPHIVTIFDRGQTAAGHVYYIMEYVEGRDGGAPIDVERLIADRCLNSQQVRSLMLQVVQALGFAHREGIIHRDVKPSNILIDRHGFAKVADFGIASMRASRDDPPCDRGQSVCRHGNLHVARATAGRGFRRSSQRHLRDGSHALPDADGRASSGGIRAAVEGRRRAFRRNGTRWLPRPSNSGPRTASPICGRLKPRSEHRPDIDRATASRSASAHGHAACRLPRHAGSPCSFARRPTKCHCRSGRRYQDGPNNSLYRASGRKPPT